MADKPHGYLSPAYCFVVPIVQRAARKVGYAVAVHGSMNSDLDLVAIPWTDDAVSTKELLEAVLHSCGVFYQRNEQGDFISEVAGGFKVLETDDFSLKPHGRMAWSLQLGAGARIDISIMPRLPRLDTLP